MEQQKQQFLAKSLELSEIRIFMYADEHTKLFMNNIEKTMSIYTKL